ncbi:hypothetical protein WYO_0191 [Methylobacterium sp. GXF4]|uniref:hypothetical protein n=1 Tax=Methylobacterium sp. GXF4 TaxID=1096546 RepID=UPI0002698F57|nr:hypothetical protein [Methylobacterium sp. GXF4]EIZ87154.1 hypothetical protein WYO_0191 [Methylobacterium sp. GXF4]
MSALTDNTYRLLRAQVTGATDRIVKLALFETVSEVCRLSLNTDPPTDPASDFTAWLDDDQWLKNHTLVIAGTLARLYAMPKRPWSDIDTARVNKEQYDTLLSYARADAAEAPSIDPSARLLGSIRSRLPGAKDSQTRLALFDMLQDACQRGRIWTEVVPFRLVPGKQMFSISQPGARIVMLINAQHPTLGMEAIQYSEEKVAIRTDIATLDPADYLYLTLALAPSLDVDLENPQMWMPADIFSSKYTLLLHGVLGAMMLQTAKPYSNTSLGQYHTQIYSRELNSAPLTDRDGGLPTRQRWRFPRFA